MPQILSDDIGSFPLPEGVDKAVLRKIAEKIILGTVSAKEKLAFDSAVSDLMLEKIDSGIMRPTYPQVQDMISAFTLPMKEYCERDNPWLVEKKYAVIPELEGIGIAAKKYYEERKEPLPVRIVVTGPLELYLAAIGKTVQADLLQNFALSVNRFIRNALKETRHLKPKVICIDEPGLGLNPNLAIRDDDLIDAWDAALAGIKGVDVEVHLHSVNGFDRICQTKGINVVGIEYAANPKALDLIGKKELEACDKYLRVGVARTNILTMAAEYTEMTGIDPWKRGGFEDMVDKLENTLIISRRIARAHALFGDRIRYMGPDCGLGPWPSQKAAKTLLTNTAKAIDEYNKMK